MSRSLHAGVAREDITPPLGTLLMGYADPHGERKAEKVRDPLYATAIAMVDGDAKAIIISLDVIAVRDEMVAAIREAIEKKTGIPGEHITIAATHTHCGPRTSAVFGWAEVDVDYVNNIMIPGSIEAAVKAAAQLVPVRVGFAETACSVGVNRRAIDPVTGNITMRQNLWGLSDPTMTVIRFESAQGPLATMVHYGAHPTVLVRNDRVISRDWPGLMADRVEQLTGAPVLFFNGAQGDIAPRTNTLKATGDQTDAALWEAGGVAGLDAMRAWRSIRDLRDVPLRVHTGSFDMPYKPLPSLEEAKANLAKFEPDKDHPGAPMAEYKHWKAVVQAHEKQAITGKPFAQVVTAIGPAAFVPMPGETFVDIVLRLREASPFQHTLVTSNATGHEAYLSTREAHERGGYEVWLNRGLGAYLPEKNLDDVFVASNLELLKKLYEQVYPPLGE